jgi:DNA-binding MarR family transcriptional regulator
MALMLSVYLGDGPHTVRGLAMALKISKPAVSRALDRLGELGYIRRQRDDLDRRNVLVQKTASGGGFLTEMSQLIDAAKIYVQTVPAQSIEFAVEPPAAATVDTYAPAPEMWARAAAE